MPRGDGEKAFRFDLLDIHLPDADGLDLLGTIRAESPDTRVIVISGDGALENMRRAMSAGTEQILEKPFDIGVVTRFIAARSPEKGSRQKHPRYLCRFPLKLCILSQCRGEEDFFIDGIGGIVGNIGRRGIRLTTEYPLRAGQVARLKPPPEADLFSCMVPADGYAEVVWVVPCGISSSAGLRFLPDRTSAP